MAQRRWLTAEFKLKTIDLVRRPHASASQMTQEPGVNVLGRWSRELARPGKTCTDASVCRNGKLTTVRRELARVKQKWDLLREAAAWVSKPIRRMIGYFMSVSHWDLGKITLLKSTIVALEGVKKELEAGYLAALYS